MRGSARLMRLRKKMDEEMGRGGGTGIFFKLPDGELADFNRETGEWKFISQEEIESLDLEMVVVLGATIPGAGPEWDKLAKEHPLKATE